MIFAIKPKLDWETKGRGESQAYRQWQGRLGNKNIIKLSLNVLQTWKRFLIHGGLFRLKAITERRTLVSVSWMVCFLRVFIFNCVWGLNAVRWVAIVTSSSWLFKWLHQNCWYFLNTKQFDVICAWRFISRYLFDGSRLFGGLMTQLTTSVNENFETTN